MKAPSRWLCLILVFFLSGLSVAGGATGPAGRAAKEKPTVGVELAKTLSEITGVAISPMLGVSVVGAYKYCFEAETPEEKAALPWYAQPKYWITGLLIVGLVALKDAAGTALPPGWKKPLDVAETLENKLSALVAAGAFIPFTLDTLTKLVGHGGGFSATALPSGLAMMHFGAITMSGTLDVLLAPFAIAVFLIVWLTAHTINVLILLSPWGAIDGALKSFRMSVLGLLVLTPHINPWLGIACSVLVIVISYFLSGWSFRLMTYGWVFCWDFFTLRRTRFTPAPRENWVFAGKGVGGVPVRTYGRVARGEDGRLRFRYRPWLVLLAKEAALPEVPLAVGRGLFYPTVEGTFGDKEKTLLLLPPRYKGHEMEFARACGIEALVEVGLLRAWGALKELFGFERQRRIAVT